MTGQWLAANLIVLLSSGLQASTGFGFALIATPLLMILLPPKDAVLTVMTVSLCSLLLLALRNYRKAHPMVFKWLLLGSLIGLPMGFYIFMTSGTNVIRLIASTVTVVVGIYFLVTLVSRTHAKNVTTDTMKTVKPLLGILTGCVSGFLTTTVSMPGPPVILTLNYASFPKEEFRATATSYFAALYCITLLLLGAFGLLTKDALLFSVSLVPATLVGNAVGESVFKRISQQVFSLTVSVLIIGAAVTNLIKVITER